MADEVSVRALDLPLRYLQKRNVDLEPILADLGLPQLHFFDHRRRIDWRTFVIIQRRVAAAIGGRERLVEIGPFLLSGKVWRPLKFIVRQFGRQQTLYRWIEQRAGKLLFSHFQSTLAETPEGLRIHLSLPAQFEPCEEFFLLNQGVFAALPTAMGYPAASVRMEGDGRSAVYDITLAPNRRLKDVLSRVLQSLRFNRVAAAAELERQLGLLEQQHGELQAAKRAVDELNRTLEQRVADRTRDLQTTTSELASTVAQLHAAMDARDQLFANLNHEFRTPISLILLPLDRMLQEPAFEPFRRKLLIMQGNARRLLRLVDNILEIAASREGRLRLRLKAVDVTAVARQATDAYGAAAESLGLTLRLSAPQGAVVMGDEDAIERIFDNLLGNAIKYTPRGGSIDVSVQTLGDTVRLAVRDTGVGIAAENHTRIFERFEKVSEPVAPGASSSGIGLAVVQELARVHGGAVAVRSELGEGATFEVTLPCAASQVLLAHQAAPNAPAQLEPLGSRALAGAELTPSSPIALQPRPEAPAGAPRILIAEDHPDLRSELVQLLGPTYRLLLAENGKEALAMLQREPVDLILSDLVMPGLDGLALCREVRRQAALELVPFVLITAVHDVKALVGALDMGADDFLVKPFNEAELLGRVRAQLRLRGMAKELAESKQQAAVGAVLSGMAHELRNPINVLVNGIDPLRESLQDARVQDASVEALVGALADAGRRVAGLTSDLLAYRREPAEPAARVRLRDLIDQSLVLLRPKLARVELSKQMGGDGEVRGSAHVLSQVVVNLVENALHATEGKGPLGIETREESDALVVDVWDEGPGVPAEHRERIFEPFFSTKRPGEGTGLGLAISRQIAERHGGSLSLAESVRGARFRLTLPRATP